METIIRILEGAAGALPVVIGFVIWIYKRGGLDAIKQASLDKAITDVAKLTTDMKAVQDGLDEMESNVSKVNAGVTSAVSAANSGMRPVIDSAKATFDAHVSTLHDKINKLRDDLTSKSTTDTQGIHATIATLRSDVEIIKTHYGHLFDTLSVIEANVTTALQTAEGEKVRIQSLEDWRTRAEDSLGSLDRNLARLEERTRKERS